MRMRTKTSYLLGRLNVYLTQHPTASNREIADALEISTASASKWARQWRTAKNIPRNRPGPSMRTARRAELARLLREAADLLDPTTTTTTTTEGTPTDEQASIHE